MRYFYVLGFLVSIVLIVGTDAGITSSISPSPTISPSVTSVTVLVYNTSTTQLHNTSSSIVPTHTAKPTAASSSAAPTTTPTTPPATGTPVPQKDKGRSFDAASFFGGIILGIVLTALFLFGYIYWKNRRKSYHSL